MSSPGPPLMETKTRLGRQAIHWLVREIRPILTQIWLEQGEEWTPTLSPSMATTVSPSGPVTVSDRTPPRGRTHSPDGAVISTTGCPFEPRINQRVKATDTPAERAIAAASISLTRNPVRKRRREMGSSLVVGRIRWSARAGGYPLRRVALTASMTSCILRSTSV